MMILLAYLCGYSFLTVYLCKWDFLTGASTQRFPHPGVRWKSSMRSSFILVPIFAQAKTYFNNFVWISKFWKVVHTLKALTKFWNLGTMAKAKVAQKWSSGTKKCQTWPFATLSAIKSGPKESKTIFNYLGSFGAPFGPFGQSALKQKSNGRKKLY